LSLDVVRLACPETKLAVPNVSAPSLKVTVPVGEPTPCRLAVTVVVKVTGCLSFDGLAELVVAMKVPPVFSSTLTVSSK
jgi:hypothetical protein